MFGFFIPTLSSYGHMTAPAQLASNIVHVTLAYIVENVSKKRTGSLSQGYEIL